MKKKIIESKPNKQKFNPDGYGEMYGVAYYYEDGLIEQDFSDEPYIIRNNRRGERCYIYPNLTHYGETLKFNDSDFHSRCHYFSKELLKVRNYIKHIKGKGINIKVVADNRDEAYKEAGKMLTEFIQNETEKKKEIESRINDAIDVLNKLESN